MGLVSLLSTFLPVLFSLFVLQNVNDAIHRVQYILVVPLTLFVLRVLLVVVVDAVREPALEMFAVGSKLPGKSKAPPTNKA